VHWAEAEDNQASRGGGSGGVQGSLMLKFNKAKRKAEKEMMEQAAGPN